MHFEAEDLNDTGNTVDDLNDRIRINFDCCDDCYIIVVFKPSYIHPRGFDEGRQQLVVPPDCENPALNWNDFIHRQGTGEAASEEAFMGVHATREACPYAAENRRIILPPEMASLQSFDRLQLSKYRLRNVPLQQEKLPTNHTDLLGGFSLPQIKKEETKLSKTSNTTSTSPVQAQNSDDNVKIDIAKEYLFEYGPRLQLNSRLWHKNLIFDTEKITSNPLKWSATEVSDFIDLYLKCRKTATIFIDEDINGEAFLLMQQDDLTDILGLKLGPAVKLHSCILQLRILAVTKFGVQYKRVVAKN